MLTQPFATIYETGLVTLIGINDQVDQNDYGPSVQLDLVTACGARVSFPISGEILQVTLISTESGSGAVNAPNGVLFFLDADPAIAAGDTTMTAAERATVIGQIEVETADWKSDANGASATIYAKPVAFHALSSLYAVWLQEHATAYNDAAGDDELLRLNAWFRRDS
jgi:hypothetical protein